MAQTGLENAVEGVAVACSSSGGACQAVQDSSPSTFGSPILPLGVLCALVCSLLGYVAFLYLHRCEEERARQLEEVERRRRAAAGVGAAAGVARKPPAGVLPPREELGLRNPTPAPASSSTPTVAPAMAAVAGMGESDGGDGNSSIRIERVSSSLLNAAEPVIEVAGATFQDLDQKATDRGPLEADVTDGNNNYVWEDGSEYFGEWQNGLAHGRGVFSWPTADRYEGEWRDGLENGVGTFIAADGSTFNGPWANGKMHGQGMFQPVVEGGGQEGDVVFMREYSRGSLIKETKLRGKDYDYLRKELKRNQRARRVEKRQAAREMNAPPRPGETIYKGHRSYNLMRSLQQGISFSVASVDKQVSAREAPREATLRPAEFKKEIVQHMPSSGEFPPFKWKDYSPYVFHCLREAFGIDNRDYLISITNRNTLRELPSPGKSGSVFFISDDERFMIKTVRKEEMHLLIDLIPKYYAHCKNNPDTLLTRFYGVHRIKPISGPQVRFVVMGNVFPNGTKMHRKYDLKGSTHGRTAGAKKDVPGAILKDLDVDFRLQLKDELYQQLMQQIRADAKFLEQMHVMDYSLLLGIHYTDDPDEPDTDQQGHINKRYSTATEGASPMGSDGQRTPWGLEFAVAESDASKYRVQEPIFSTWRSKRNLDVDEPSPSKPSVASSRGEMARPTPLANQEGTLSSMSSAASAAALPHAPHSAVKPDRLLSSSSTVSSTSLTLTSQSGAASTHHLSLSLATASFTCAPQRGGWTSTSSAQAPREEGALPMPSGYSSPHRPSRFARESQAAATLPAATLPDGSSVVVYEDDAGSADTSRQQGASVSTVELLGATANVQAWEGGEAGGVEPAGGSETGVPRFLRMLSKLSAREEEDRGVTPKAPLDRTRSGWLKAEEEGTSLRSLHAAARHNMGVSIPAVAYPLRQDGTADTDVKPQPVTLFFGIIDFLQLYNFRKWGEHQLKSIVSDGSQISVTNPKTYSKRFTRHMQTLFIPIPGQ